MVAAKREHAKRPSAPHRHGLCSGEDGAHPVCGRPACRFGVATRPRGRGICAQVVGPAHGKAGTPHGRGRACVGRRSGKSWRSDPVRYTL